MNLRSRRFETKAQARAFLKEKQQSGNWKFADWHIRKIPNAKKLKFFVGLDIEWLNLD